MSFDAVLHWLEATTIATTIAENDTLFPWIESVHVLAITLVVGSIFIVDLRLISWASLDRRAHDLMSEVLPITWAAFTLAVITGLLPPLPPPLSLPPWPPPFPVKYESLSTVLSTLSNVRTSPPPKSATVLPLTSVTVIGLPTPSRSIRSPSLWWKLPELP